MNETWSQLLLEQNDPNEFVGLKRTTLNAWRARERERERKKKRERLVISERLHYRTGSGIS